MDADPLEKINLMESLPDVGGRLQKKLNEIIAEMESATSHSTRAIDSETEAMLRSLGYVAGNDAVARVLGRRSQSEDAELQPDSVRHRSVQQAKTIAARSKRSPEPRKRTETFPWSTNI